MDYFLKYNNFWDSPSLVGLSLDFANPGNRFTSPGINCRPFYRSTRLLQNPWDVSIRTHGQAYRE